MKKILARIWFGIKMFLFSMWWVIAAIIIAFLIGWIFGGMVGVWTFFGLVGAVIAYVFLRQIWWFISGTGDYQGRNGLLKRLWKKIFK